MTKNTTAVLSYAIYMANAWSISEATAVYGESLGAHIFNKWSRYNSDGGPAYASMKLIYELDNTNLEKLVERANELYDGRANKH